ncbi:hypothetical protein T484DRAFT_3380309 [Baffinella frigidus]|nr:hypothetical protein T484DRAFT_3380309 [Cryptophyta sp. CCMP2293]
MVRLALLSLCIMFTTASAFTTPYLSVSLRLPGAHATLSKPPSPQAPKSPQSPKVLSRQSPRCTPSSARLTALRMTTNEPMDPATGAHLSNFLLLKFQTEMDTAVLEERFEVPFRSPCTLHLHPASYTTPSSPSHTP